MKKLLHGRKRVIIFAAVIIILSAVVFIVSTQIAIGAEESKTVSQQSTYDSSRAPQVTGEAVISDDPGTDFITGEQAVAEYTWTATELFGGSVDKSALTVRFESEPNIEGIVHNEWYIDSPEYSCGVDAATGTVIYFEVRSGTYPGSSITLGDFDSKSDGDIRGNPDNIYIKAARDLVTTKLAEGRKIDYIEIDGIGFEWDDESGGFDPDETGTIMVDCHVYMETGMCYTLTYWGTDEIALNRFFSNPTKQACEAGFYFLDQADDNPPYGWKGGFITEENANSETVKTASNIFGLSIDESKLTATFEAAHDLIDGKGKIVGTTHDNWQVNGPDLYCQLDALTGEVLFLSSESIKYTGSRITLEDSNTAKYSADIVEDPNNAYSKLAEEIVNSKLANGRKIESIVVSGIQFVWDNNNEGLEPKAKGTIQVDCCVYMESGRCYSLSFWGTEQLELRVFSSHPTKDACKWGYFYEDQAEEYSGHA